MLMELKLNIKNGTCNIKAGNYETGKPIHIEVHPNKLYGITGTSPAYLTYRYKATGISNGYRIAFTRIGDSESFELDATLVNNDELIVSIDYTYNRKYIEIKNNLTNCTTNCPDADNYIAMGTETTIILKADDNYEFSVTPTISYWAWDNEPNPTQQSLQYLDFFFTRISDTEYSYTFTPNTNYNEVYTVHAIATNKTNISDKYGFIAAYKPDKGILKRLSETRFIKQKLEPINIDKITLYLVNKEYTDLAEYIISLHKVFIKVDTDKNENIFLGPYNTEIECPIINQDIIVIDMGTVIINGKYDNAMDYNNTQIEIYLPFIGIIDLPTSDFMNKSINLKYNVNIINGDTLVLLSCDNNIMKTITCNTAFKIPLTIKDKEYMESSRIDNKVESKSNYLLEEKPFIYIKSFNKAMPNNEPPYNNTKFYSIFSDVHGYTEATEIDFNVIHSYITKTEIDEIKNIIETGIFLP